MKIQTHIKKIPFIIWIIALWILSSMPSPPKPIEFEISDKILHIAYFLSGTILFQFGWQNPKALLSLSILISIGILDEFHQSFVAGRQGNDLGDIIANSIGVILGYYISKFIFKIYQKCK